MKCYGRKTNIIKKKSFFFEEEEDETLTFCQVKLNYFKQKDSVSIKFS